MIVDALGHETEHKTPVSSKHSNKATDLEAKENGTSVKDKQLSCKKMHFSIFL
jgi:hypothetical protein